MTMATPVTPITLEVMRSALTAIAEEMGVVLMRSSYSPNIKERRDFSCALFDAAGLLVAQAAHIPVHLGSMPDSVAAALARIPNWAPGDVVALNDPYLGGTHLPDITLITPIFAAEELIGFAANRAHHSDVGGISAGSMPLASEIYQEGIIIPPVKLWEAGQPNAALLALILRNVRTPHERQGDLAAQVAANRTAAVRLAELAARWGNATLAAHIHALYAYAERMTRATLAAIPSGTYSARDQLDDDGQGATAIAIVATITVADGTLAVDFTGSAPQVAGNVNTVLAVAKSAAYYCVRCLLPDDAPINAGTFAPVSVIAPEGSVVCARPSAAVAQGNVETSQRLVDVIFRALAPAMPETIPAASQGTMNNIAAGGMHPETGQPFTYYETMGGGMGGRPGLDGLSGVHVHMSNTLNTPIEAFEYAYPMRITQYALRVGSGGAGAARGGDGLIRTIEFLTATHVTLLSERRVSQPYGLHGGAPGMCGENSLTRRGETKVLPGKIALWTTCGDQLTIATPGGGGWGQENSGMAQDLEKLDETP